MLTPKLLIFLCLMGYPAYAIVAPTCSQIAAMSNDIRRVLVNGLQPLPLRLGFHDCVGGCNGCINFNNPDNAGLEEIVGVLKNLYTSRGYNRLVSLADFYALATTVSVTSGVGASNQQRSGNPWAGPCPNPCFALQWGRKTAVGCSTDASVLPSPLMTGDAMFAYFQKEFGFTRAQVTALMGAHSFGGAQRMNSGYSGKWTGPNEGFSELFYYQMINPALSWFNVNAAPPRSPAKWQFDAFSRDGSKAGFMLNTDFELFYNLKLSSNAQTTCNLSPRCGVTNTCGATNCQKSSTFPQALAYSRDCTLFMNDFVPVLQAMLRNGYSSSQLVTTRCC